MSLQYKVADQVLTVYDDSEATANIVKKYDAFFNLLCAGKYSFQREAIQNPLRFLVSQKYPHTERLAIENFNLKDGLRKRYTGKEEFLEGCRFGTANVCRLIWPLAVARAM